MTRKRYGYPQKFSYDRKLIANANSRNMIKIWDV